MTQPLSRKPLGIKSYGHIAHLPGSRMGPSDHHCHEGQARIATQKARDRHDHIIVQEKLDGCLAYRTPIWTDRGLIPIGKIVNQQLPVLVASYNETMSVVEFKPILEYHKQPNVGHWLRVVVRGLKHGSSMKQLVCTPNHRFYSKGLYKRADELSPGDVVHLSGIDIPRESKQVVLGGLLGDSGILHPQEYNSYGFTFNHSVAQNGYFDFKLQLLGTLVYEVKGSKGGFDGSMVNRRACSRLVPGLHRLITGFCLDETGKKTVTAQWGNELTPLALAIWYMDDGSIRRNTYGQRHRARIATNGFSFNEVGLLSSMLKTRFGVDNDVFDYKGPTIVLTANGSERFFDLIYPFVPSCMRHKLPAEYQSRLCVLDSVVLEPTNSLFETVVVAIETESVKVWEGESSQYDLTVADNHNYFASDILVHNSNVSVARLGERIVALTRAGYIASTSPYEQHHHFEKWAHRNRDRFMAVLQDGERLVGEWLMQAHGTRYELKHEPFVTFDLMTGQERMTYDNFLARIAQGEFVTPHLLHRGSPLSIADALRLVGAYGFHGALDLVEGAVWRVERNEQISPNRGDRRLVVDFIVKYVRPDKVDGAYLPEMSGQPPVYNWWPG